MTENIKQNVYGRWMEVSMMVMNLCSLDDVQLRRLVFSVLLANRRKIESGVNRCMFISLETSQKFVKYFKNPRFCMYGYVFWFSSNFVLNRMAEDRKTKISTTGHIGEVVSEAGLSFETV